MHTAMTNTLTNIQDCLTVPADQEAASLSTLARGLIGSGILKISAEITALKGQGRQLCNLTVGDFSPAEFRIPAALEQGIAEMLAAGQTNYPPSDGTIELRRAVARFYEEQLGLPYP